MEDLELKSIGNFYGTDNYYSLKPLFHTVATDGVNYIMRNGYAWVVTDALSVIELKLRGKDYFFAIHLKVHDDGTATLKITDGNDKTWWEHRYMLTDAKRDLTLFWADGVIMLDSEY